MRLVLRTWSLGLRGSITQSVLDAGLWVHPAYAARSCILSASPGRGPVAAEGQGGDRAINQLRELTRPRVAVALSISLCLLQPHQQRELPV